MHKINGVLYKQNCSLKKYNTFRVNAKALHFYMPETINGFIDLIKYLKETAKETPYLLREEDEINLAVVFLRIPTT